MGADQRGADKRGVTRRTVVGAAAGGAIGAALPWQAQAKSRKRKPSRKRKADVVVVGAGIAGLAAARDLVKAKRSVIVLEARDRIGGRAFSQPALPGSKAAVEMGAQGLQQTHTQTKMTAFAQAVGVTPTPHRLEGDNVFHRGGSAQRYDRNGPTGRVPPSVAGIADAQQAVARMESMAAELDPDEPWKHFRAEEWDSQTLETWKLANTATPDGRFLVDLGARLFIGCEPRDVSLFYLLTLLQRFGTEPVAPRGKNAEMLETTGTIRFPGGVQGVAERHARKLGIGKRVFTGTPVRSIQERGGKVTVTSDKLTVTAKRVIIAMPPWVARYIAFDPILPPWKALLMQRYPMASSIKAHVVYDEPFWRADGLTGEAISDGSPLCFCSDETPPEGGPGVLYGLISGREARVWALRSAADRRQAVLENLASFFGPRALKPTRYVDYVWADDLWARGGFAGFTVPGGLFDYGLALREMTGRVHWAGSEVASRWTGSLEGAVISGQETAKEVLSAL